VVVRADEADRRRLNDLFVELCRIESPSGREADCGARVRAELEGLGLAVEADEAGNLLARVVGRADATLMLCAHLDTVKLEAPVEPALVDEGWENANDGILGADNKAAVAMLLAIAHRAAAAAPPIGLELLFTVSEEVGLVGAQAFDLGKLRSQFGYVFDHATPIGEIVLAAPTYFRIEADFHGAAAHAGIRPEHGRSAIAAAAASVAAMRLGRLDDETTANVGRIAGGGESTNVVPEHCRIEAEARSLDSAKAEGVVAEMVDHIHDGANAFECDVDVSVERLWPAYRIRPSVPAVAVADAALRACGYEPSHIVTGGGSDANAFNDAGLQCVNLANGTERNHEPGERVSVAALEGMLDVTLALVDEAAARC
jgi:tripeptide aminopeptidase